MKLNIDLSESGPCCGPSEVSREPYYPQLHITGKKELHLPKEGTMVIRYRKVGSSEHGSGENMRYTCDIAVHEIVSAKADEEVEAPSKRDKSAEESLDALAKEKAKDY